jgi:hypothetical protein
VEAHDFEAWLPQEKSGCEDLALLGKSLTLTPRSSCLKWIEKGCARKQIVSRCRLKSSIKLGFSAAREQETKLLRLRNNKNPGGNRAGIRKSGLALLQVNNIKIALTLKRSAAGTG